MIHHRGDLLDLANLNDSSFTRPLGRTLTTGIIRRAFNRIGASTLFQPEPSWLGLTSDTPSALTIYRPLLASPQRRWLRPAIHYAATLLPNRLRRCKLQG